ncbi:EF-hand domain-containing protein [Kiritimatiellota bacterium B12222]|nr:EF-hand domain-containing protein [Kiritimatiellota bacterium B12222]
MKTLLTTSVLLLLAAGTAMAQPGTPKNDKQKPPTPQEMITLLDKDEDGKISIEEFDGPEEHFTMFDKNGDGFLTIEELPSGPPKGGKRGGKQ